MLAYIPTGAFTGASLTDYVVFYNLNGVHYQADDGTSSDAGFEEWSALTGPSSSVPDGTTVMDMVSPFAQQSADGAAKPEDKDKAGGKQPDKKKETANSSEAAQKILQKYMRRQRT